MIRAFVAIALPEDILSRVEAVCRRLGKLDLEGRFPTIDSIHLTLKFLGDLDEKEIQIARQVVEESVQGVAPFEIEIRSLGVFPHPGNPRVVWMGVGSGEQLPALHRRIEEGFAGRGFARDHRQFHPHLTLCRLKTRRNCRGLIEYLQGEGSSEQAGVTTVKAVYLYQSTLRPEGAEYRQLATSKLRNRSMIDC